MSLVLMRQAVAELTGQKERTGHKIFDVARSLKETIRVLQQLCDEIKRLQDADDQDVQWIYRDLGELAGAEDQQRLGVLLSASDQQIESGKTTSLLSATLDINPNVRSVRDLLAIVETIRVRHKRVDVVRLKAFATSAENAIARSDWPAAQRFVENIVIELARGMCP